MKKKITINFDAELLKKVDEISHGKIYRSHYQVLINDILAEAIKDPKLILRVLNAKQKELK